VSSDFYFESWKSGRLVSRVEIRASFGPRSDTSINLLSLAIKIQTLMLNIIFHFRI
jgi:hypothetical protein